MTSKRQHVKRKALRRTRKARKGKRKTTGIVRKTYTIAQSNIILTSGSNQVSSSEFELTTAPDITKTSELYESLRVVSVTLAMRPGATPAGTIGWFTTRPRIVTYSNPYDEPLAIDFEEAMNRKLARSHNILGFRRSLRPSMIQIDRVSQAGGTQVDVQKKVNPWLNTATIGGISYTGYGIWMPMTTLGSGAMDLFPPATMTKELTVVVEFKGRRS